MSHVALCAQIVTIMDCMYPTSLAKGCCVIQEGDDGSTVYVLEGEKPTAQSLGRSPDSVTAAMLTLDAERLNEFLFVIDVEVQYGASTHH